MMGSLSMAVVTLSGTKPRPQQYVCIALPINLCLHSFFFLRDLLLPLPTRLPSSEMDDQFDSKTETFLKWLNHAGVQISAKAELTDLRADGRGRALGMWLLSRCFPTRYGYCMQYDKTFFMSHYHTVFVIGFRLINFSVAKGDFAEDELIFSVPRTSTLSVKAALPELLSDMQDVSAEGVNAMPGWAVSGILYILRF